MKKMILAIVAMMTVTAAMAQGDNQQGRGERRQFDRTEMIKNRTDNTVKQYGLNEEQAAKLLELNTKYADTMTPRMGGRGGNRGGVGRPRPDFGGNAQQGQRPEMNEEMRAQMEKMRKEREEAQKKYDEELQTILTPEQFKAYQADAEKRMKERGRRGGGPRGQRGQRND
jgi:Spy/CpxP family protein refolding chaperone